MYYYPETFLMPIYFSMIPSVALASVQVREERPASATLSGSFMISTSMPCHVRSPVFYPVKRAQELGEAPYLYGAPFHQSLYAYDSKSPSFCVKMLVNPSILSFRS